jgi:hypothetical protein
MELRKLAWPGLRQRRWANFAWEGSEGVQKNWVPLKLHEGHVLFSHSLEPHIVLRCDLPPAGTRSAPGAGGLYNRTIVDPHWPGGVRYEMAERPASPEARCMPVHKTSAVHIWRRAKFHLYQGIARSSSIRAIPRGGTPCVRFVAQSLVCLGHFRTRLSVLDKRSTYFHFFYALQSSAPFAITNVSRPFRFASVGTTAADARGGGGGGADAKGHEPNADPDRLKGFREESVQFAAGMVPLDAHTMRVTYGIGDCISATRDLAVADLLALLSGQLELDIL